MKFAIGDKAVEKSNVRAHTNYLVYMVVGILDGAYLVKFWGDGFGDEVTECEYDMEGEPGSRGWHTAIIRYQEEELFTPEEALVELRKLESDLSKLEKEFNGVRDQIQQKLDDAATLVREAAALAKPFDKDFYDLKRECKSLYHAMDDGGWSHSNMRC